MSFTSFHLHPRIVAGVQALGYTIPAPIQLQAMPLRRVTLYGGVGMQPQVQKLRAGVDIAVACPGRLLDHMRQGTINLSHLEVLVLDEAGRLFDMGFLPDIRRIVRHLPARRQTLLFSATMPEAIWHLAQDILRTPVTVQIDHTVPLPTISHALYPVAPHLKTALLIALFRHTKPASGLVFTRTKHQAKRVAHHLAQAGYRATSLQGNLSQSKRQAALEGFRSGAFEILVATDLAARGLDVWHISHVINYDMPETVDAYMHRIGALAVPPEPGWPSLSSPTTTWPWCPRLSVRSARRWNDGRCTASSMPHPGPCTRPTVAARHTAGSHSMPRPPQRTSRLRQGPAYGKPPQVSQVWHRSLGRRWQPAVAVRHGW